MRILHIVPTYLPAVRYGGPIHSVHGLCAALAKRGHEVSVYTTNVDGPGDSLVPLNAPLTLDGVRVHYHRSRFLRRLYYSPSLAWRLRDTVQGFDLVHLHSVFLWPTLAAARVAARYKVPYVVSPRGMLVPALIARKNRWIKTAWIRWFERCTLESAAAVHVTSELERQDLNPFGFRLRHVFVAPNGVSVPEQAPTLSREQPPVVLFVGRINWKKGLERLIEALREVPNARLEIAGNDEEGLLPRLRMQAEAMGVDARVRFLGFVEGERKNEWYRRASVLVLPSLSENFGNVALEAMTQGCPVVLSDTVGLAKAVHQHGAGRVCSGDSADLARALNELLANEILRQACGQAAYDLARRDYGWPTVAAEMEAHYRQMLERADA